MKVYIATTEAGAWGRGEEMITAALNAILYGGPTDTILIWEIEADDPELLARTRVNEEGLLVSVPRARSEMIGRRAGVRGATAALHEAAAALEAVLQPRREGGG